MKENAGNNTNGYGHCDCPPRKRGEVLRRVFKKASIPDKHPFDKVNLLNGMATEM